MPGFSKRAALYDEYRFLFEQGRRGFPFIDRSASSHYAWHPGVAFCCRGRIALRKFEIAIGLLFLGLIFLVAALIPDHGRSLQAQNASQYGNLQRIYLSNFFCRTVQKDSAFNPSNEIGLIVSYQENSPGKPSQRFTRIFPNPGLYDMTAGKLYTILPSNGRIWSGEARGLFVAAAAVEVDDRPGIKRKTVDEVGRQAAAWSFPGSYRNPSLAYTDRLRRSYRGAVRQILAAGEDDYAGADLVYIDGENQEKTVDWGETEFQTDHIRSRYTNTKLDYHFKLRMTAGGSDCTAYFRYDRAEKFGEWPQDIQALPSDPLALKQEHVCIAGSKRWHVKDGNLLRYLGGGGRTTDGHSYTPRDRNCLFEFDIAKGRPGAGSYCVADRGKLRRKDSRGRSVGSCYRCSGQQCRDGAMPSAGGGGQRASYRVGRDMICNAYGKNYHLTGDRVLSHDGVGGKALSRGNLKAAADKNCHFMMHMDGINQKFCMGDYGHLTLTSSKGKRLGSCRACSGDACKEQ